MERRILIGEKGGEVIFEVEPSSIDELSELLVELFKAHPDAFDALSAIVRIAEVKIELELRRSEYGKVHSS